MGFFLISNFNGLPNIKTSGGKHETILAMVTSIGGVGIGKGEVF